MARRYELLLVVIWALTFAAAGAWPHLAGEPFPLPGLRKVAEAGDFSRVLQVLSVFLAGAWLVFRPWQTRERLLLFQGVALALSVQGFLYIGVPFGLAFACFAGVARSRSNKQEQW